MKNLELVSDYIHNIHLEDSQIEWDEDDKDHFFPYHFSKNTMKSFVAMWIDKENSVKKYTHE